MKHPNLQQDSSKIAWFEEKEKKKTEYSSLRYLMQQYQQLASRPLMHALEKKDQLFKFKKWEILDTPVRAYFFAREALSLCCTCSSKILQKLSIVISKPSKTLYYSAFLFYYPFGK